MLQLSIKYIVTWPGTHEWPKSSFWTYLKMYFFAITHAGRQVWLVEVAGIAVVLLFCIKRIFHSIYCFNVRTYHLI